MPHDARKPDHHRRRPAAFGADLPGVAPRGRPRRLRPRDPRRSQHAEVPRAARGLAAGARRAGSSSSRGSRRRSSSRTANASRSTSPATSRASSTRTGTRASSPSRRRRAPTWTYRGARPRDPPDRRRSAATAPGVRVRWELISGEPGRAARAAAAHAALAPRGRAARRTSRPQIASSGRRGAVARRAPAIRRRCSASTGEITRASPRTSTATSSTRSSASADTRRSRTSTRPCVIRFELDGRGAGRARGVRRGRAGARAPRRAAPAVERRARSRQRRRARGAASPPPTQFLIRGHDGVARDRRRLSVVRGVGARHDDRAPRAVPRDRAVRARVPDPRRLGVAPRRTDCSRTVSATGTRSRPTRPTRRSS